MGDFAVALALAAGLSLALVLWLVCFWIGAAILTLAGSPSPTAVAARQIETTIATATGCAIVIAVSFALAATGNLRAVPLVSCLIIVMVLVTIAACRRRGARRYAAESSATLRACLSPAWLGALAVAIALSGPAVLPPTAFDAGMYHLPHAYAWASSGHLAADPFVRFPLGEYNVELLFADVFALHLDRCVQFVAWLGFAWTLTSIAGAVTYFLDRHGIDARIAALLAFLAAAGFGAGPLALRYADVPLIDITAGATLLACTMAAVRARDDFERYSLAFALIAGSFVGMKSSFLPFAIALPVVLLSIARAAFAEKRRALLALGLYAALAAPWFLRSIVVAGDPISPILNDTFGRTDPFYSSDDYTALQNVLHHRNESLISLPVRLFVAPADFEEYGTSLNVVFLYAPIFAMLALLVYKPLRRSSDLTLLTTITGLSICAVFAVTDLVARYLLHVYALYVVWFAVAVPLAFRLIARRRQVRAVLAPAVASAAIVAIGAIPSPSSGGVYAEFGAAQHDLSTGVRAPDAYLDRLPGYAEIAYLSGVLRERCAACRVLTVGLENDTYFFRRSGVESIGDWFGRARYYDLVTAEQHGTLNAYLRGLGVGAVLFRTAEVDRWVPGRSEKLVASIERAGFVEHATGDQTTMLLRRDLAGAAATAIAAGNAGVAPRASPGAVERPTRMLSLLDLFARGTISSEAPAQTPTHRGVLVYSWSDGLVKRPALTVLSGYSYRYENIETARGAVLEFDVAKVLSVGGAASAWIDEDIGKKHVRIFAAACDPASNDQPGWQHERIALPPGDVSLTFGADSLGNDNGDWIGYAAPFVSNAALH